MSTGSRRPPSPPPDLTWPEDEVTIVDGAQLVEALNETPNGDQITPVELPRCTDCGRVVVFDDFTQAASAVAMNLFSADRCVRARDGHWWWCGELWQVVYKPPR